MNSEVKLFENEEFGKVRVIVKNGEPWFVAKDVCTILEIANSRDAVGTLDADEKGVGSTDTLGGKQEVSVVSESGLYSLVFRSRKPEAKRFRKWVTSEVLPSIRKTGGYGRTITLDEKLAAAAVVLRPAGIEGNQLTLALDKIHRRELGYSALESTGIELTAPMQSHLLTPTQLGKQLSPFLSARKVNNLLELAGYQTKEESTGLWSPTQQGLDAGAVLVDTGKQHGSGTPVRQLKWPQTIVSHVQVDADQLARPREQSDK